MSTCVDAFPLLSPVSEALQRVHATQAYRYYPDPESRTARARLAAVTGVDADRIDVAPGAAELIWTLARTLLAFGERALAWKPCFSEFEHAAAAVGASVHECFDANATPGVQLDPLARLERLSDAVARVRPRLVYLCAPSCPDGEWVPARALRRIACRHEAVTFVIDQSYLAMSGHAEECAVRFPDNTVLLRSVTKELGLPGVRAGYALLRPELRARLRAQRPCWPLGTHAQAVLEVYGACLPWLATRRSLLLAQARALAEGLRAVGLNAQLRDTHYFTLNLGTAQSAAQPSAPSTNAAHLTEWLWREARIAVRDCTSFGLPNHVRVVAHPEQQRLLSACAEWQRRRSAG